MESDQINNKEIAKSGVLLVRRDRVDKERFAVLWQESPNGEEKARLELYGDDKQFRKRKPTKKVYNTADMTAAVEEATDGMNSFVIVMRSQQEALRFAAASERDRHEWLTFLQEFINRTPSARRLGYDHIWHNLRLLPLELGAAAGLAVTEVECSFAFNLKEVAIIRPMRYQPHFVCSMRMLRSCGSRDNCVSLTCGRRAPFGEGRLYLRAANSSIAREVRSSLHTGMVKGANLPEPAPASQQLTIDVLKGHQPLTSRSLPPTPEAYPSLPHSGLTRGRQHGNTITLGQLNNEQSRQVLPLPKPPSLHPSSSLPQPHRPRANQLSSSLCERPAITRQISEPVVRFQRSHTIHFSPPAGNSNCSVQSLEKVNSFEDSSSLNTSLDQTDGSLASLDKEEKKHDLDEVVSVRSFERQPSCPSDNNLMASSLKSANRKAVVGENVIYLECCSLPASEMSSYKYQLEGNENHTVSDAIAISTNGLRSATRSSRCSSHSDRLSVDHDAMNQSNDCEEMFDMETNDTMSVEPTAMRQPSVGSNYVNVRGVDFESVDSGYSEISLGASRKAACSPEVIYGELSFSPDTSSSQRVALPLRLTEKPTMYQEVDFVQTNALKVALKERENGRTRKDSLNQ